MSLKLTKGSHDDIPRMMEIVADGWKNDDLWAPTCGDTTKQDQIDYLMGIFKASFTQPYHKFIKFVDEDNGTLAAWTILQVPAPQSEEVHKAAEQNMPAPPETMNQGLVPELFRVLLIGESNGYDPEKDCHRRGTFVDPAYQKKGLGTQMTLHCNEIADSVGARTFVPARPSSKHMFEKCGYVEKATVHVDMSKYTDQDYLAKNWLLIREPQKA